MKFSYKIERKNINSIRLRLTAKNTFIISAPFFMPLFIINRFIDKNKDWIETNSKKITCLPKINKLESLVILGISYKLIFRKTISSSLVVNQDSKEIHLNSNSFTSNSLKKLFDQKMRNFALKLINQELKNLSLEHKFKYNRVTLRNQSSRYGSCSSRGNLNFNWQIIFFPPNVFRHLLLHELTHLAIKNHKKEFWNQLKIYDSDALINNRWLKTNGKNYLLF